MIITYSAFHEFNREKAMGLKSCPACGIPHVRARNIRQLAILHILKLDLAESARAIRATLSRRISPKLQRMIFNWLMPGRMPNYLILAKLMELHEKNLISMEDFQAIGQFIPTVDAVAIMYSPTVSPGISNN